MRGYRISRKKVNPDIIEFTGNKNSEILAIQWISYSANDHKINKDIHPSQLIEIWS